MTIWLNVANDSLIWENTSENTIRDQTRSGKFRLYLVWEWRNTHLKFTGRYPEFFLFQWKRSACEG